MRAIAAAFRFIAIWAATLAAPAIAAAQAYPSHPVHFEVGYAAGLAPDLVARLIALSLSDRLGQPVVAENRPGASSNIAMETVARAAPDGYTLLDVTFANAINATMYHDLNFDIVHDIVPIAGTFQAPTVMAVTPSVPAVSVPEFIAYAKANPGKLNYASSGYGTVPNIAGELFNIMAGVKLTHVPYHSSFMPDLLSGQVQLTFVPLATTLGAIKAGKLRALAVTSATRWPSLPDVPAMAEFLPGFVVNIWHGIGAPKGTPPDVVDKLNREINTVLAEPAIRQRFAEIGGEPIGGSAAAFGTLVADDTRKWGTVIRTANIKPE